MLVNPQRCRDLFYHTTSFFLHRQTLGVILTFLLGAQLQSLLRLCRLLGILSTFPAERLDFLAWHSHSPLPAPSCTFGRGPCDPCRDHSQQIRQGLISPHTQGNPWMFHIPWLSQKTGSVFPLKTGLEISALITDSGEELQAEPGKEVVQEFWFQCPA